MADRTKSREGNRESYDAMARDGASALSQLKIGIGRRAVFWEAAWNTEVSHAEEVHCALIETGTQHVAGGGQEAQRRQSEGATRPDSVEGRRGRPRLERPPDR